MWPLAVQARVYLEDTLNLASVEELRHDHRFGQDKVQPAERRTLIVALMTAATMVAEIIGGAMFGSMALLADGLHMGTHGVALGISVFVYRYARKHADDPSFSFGTGKANALGGFSGALLLAVVAVVMVWESVNRLLDSTAIAYNQAILVAVIGLAVNGVSVLLLNVGSDHHHDHGSDHDHQHRHEDHNLRSAYLHALTDAITSVLAIGALLVAKYFGLNWIDPAVGVLGAALVGRWSVGLLRMSAGVLLDKQAPREVTDTIIRCLEAEGDCRVVDLHVWSIAPGSLASIARIAAAQPLATDEYRARIPEDLGLAHTSIEVVAARREITG